MIIPLHAHSTNGSLKRSVLTVDEYINKASELGLDHLALTDYCSMSAAIEFHDKCRKHSIKPIIGIEINITNDINPSVYGEKYTIVLLAKNYDGYLRLVRYHNTMQFNKMTVTHKDICAIGGDNLMVLFPCNINPIVFAKANNDDHYVRIVLSLYSVFDNILLGIHPSDNTKQQYVNNIYMKLEKEYGLVSVIDNDIYYLNRDDSIRHNLHLKACIGDDDVSTMIMPDEYHYMMTDTDVCSIELKDASRIIAQTNAIADECNVIIDFDRQMPCYRKIPQKYDNQDSYLTDICMKELVKKASHISNQNIYMDRLKYELDTITSLGFSGYFLVVYDIVHYARNNNIAIGPGRGSCGGSIVSWLLGITVPDPIKYGLSFDRFLSKHRADMPDIDIDVCPEGRSKLQKYATDTYGINCCALISTINYRKSKAALRDAGRLLNIDVNIINNICELLPNTCSVIGDVIKDNDKLRRYSNEYKELFDVAGAIENLPVSEGIHPAGILISRKSLIDKIPVRMVSGIDINVSALCKDDSERYAIKFDFLSLNAVNEISSSLKTRNVVIDLNDDRFYGDQGVWDMICAGDTNGVFQISSRLYKDRLPRLKPRSILELANCLALIRTPCIVSGTDKLYANAANNRIPPISICYEYDNATRDTYGVCIYQEQLMQLCVNFGFTIDEANRIRKACSKKDIETISTYADKLRKLIAFRGYGADIQDKILNILLMSASYSFNKSHAICYAMLCYESAWVKIHCKA